MQSLIRHLVLALVALAVTANDARPQQEDRAIRIGERLSLRSEVLGEDRAYWVYLPDSYDAEGFAPQSYPVLYLLDGNAHFHSASGVVQFMSEGINGNIQVPEMIVVAIPNTNRTRDLTPTHTTKGYDGSESPPLGVSGGGDAFLRFIREELFPEIESSYRTKPYRTLVGHSFGGLLGAHALLSQPDMFQSYVLIDPSLWWDDQVMVRRVEERLPAVRRPGAVYLSLANNPPFGGVDPQVMVDAGYAFGRALEAAPSLRTEVQYFDGEDHGSVPLISLYNGLLHIFDGYKPSFAQLRERPAELAPHFARVSERLGFEVLPPEPMVDRLARALGASGELDAAIELLKVNAANYPSSYNVYESLAEAYERKGDTALAVANYERVLQMEPDRETARKKLSELRGGH